MTHKTEPKKKNRYYLTGYAVVAGLAILTIIEYYAAIYFNSAILLFLLAIFKAALVLNYFMHVSSLWSPEEEH